MKIELKEIKISEVTNGYLNDNEEGVIGFGGILECFDQNISVNLFTKKNNVIL